MCLRKKYFMILKVKEGRVVKLGNNKAYNIHDILGLGERTP